MELQKDLFVRNFFESSYETNKRKMLPFLVYSGEQNEVLSSQAKYVRNVASCYGGTHDRFYSGTY